LLATVSACNRNTPSPTSSDPTAAHKAAITKTVQCLIDHNAIPKNDLKAATWVTNGQLAPNVDFSNWYGTHENVTFGGKTLLAWTEEAEKEGKSWKCPL
jgi:hypothetical protein